MYRARAGTTPPVHEPSTGSDTTFVTSEKMEAWCGFFNYAAFSNVMLWQIMTLVALHVPYMVAKAPIQWDARQSTATILADKSMADVGAIICFAIAAAAGVTALAFQVTGMVARDKVVDKLTPWVPFCFKLSLSALGWSMFSSAFSNFQGSTTKTGFDANYASSITQSYHAANNTFNPSNVYNMPGDTVFTAGFAFICIGAILATMSWVYLFVNMGRNETWSTEIHVSLFRVSLGVTLLVLFFYILGFGFMNYQFFNTVTGNTPDVYNAIRYTALLAIVSLVFYGLACVGWLFSVVFTTDFSFSANVHG